MLSVRLYQKLRASGTPLSRPLLLAMLRVAAADPDPSMYFFSDS